MYSSHYLLIALHYGKSYRVLSPFAYTHWLLFSVTSAQTRYDHDIPTRCLVPGPQHSPTLKLVNRARTVHTMDTFNYMRRTLLQAVLFLPPQHLSSVRMHWPLLPSWSHCPAQACTHREGPMLLSGQTICPAIQALHTVFHPEGTNSAGLKRHGRRMWAVSRSSFCSNAYAAFLLSCFSTPLQWALWSTWMWDWLLSHS